MLKALGGGRRKGQNSCKGPSGLVGESTPAHWPGSLSLRHLSQRPPPPPRKRENGPRMGLSSLLPEWTSIPAGAPSPAHSPGRHQSLPTPTGRGASLCPSLPPTHKHSGNLWKPSCEPTASQSHASPWLRRHNLRCSVMPASAAPPGHLACISTTYSCQGHRCAPRCCVRAYFPVPASRSPQA